MLLSYNSRRLVKASQQQNGVLKMENLINDEIQENLAEKLEELYHNDAEFQEQVQAEALKYNDFKCCSDEDYILVGFEYLEALQRHMLDGFDGIVPNTLETVREWTVSYLGD